MQIYFKNNPLSLTKIVITGSPGTGKTSIINVLKKNGYTCFDEYSRILIKLGKKNGIKNYFLEKPNLFSSKILDARIKQFNESENIKESKGDLIFFDRSIYDTFVYQKFINKSFIFSSKYNIYKYQKVFVLPPWNKIFLNDNERLEDFKTTKIIDKHINLTYNYYDYKICQVPKVSIEKRINFILNNC